MLHIALQVWGGVFSLLNKIGFSLTERTGGSTKYWWRVVAWTAEFFAAPAWFIIFFLERNWIAFGLEVGNAPSLIMGFAAALRGVEKTPRWLTWVAGSAALGGTIYSFSHMAPNIRQVFEFGMVAGLLVGTFFLGRQKPRVGYPCYMLMNASTAALMGAEDYPWLALQQLVCLSFVLDAYLSEKRNRRTQSTHQ